MSSRVYPRDWNCGSCSAAHHRWHPLGDRYRPQPGDWVLFDGHAAPSSARPPHPPGYTRHGPPPAPVPGTAAQQAFITMIAPGAIAARHQYGIPAAVTIAQAIDESGWGHSELATADNNLFGIKGTGPAGTDMRPTREYDNGIWVTRTAPFRIYHDITQSITECATPGPDVPVAHAAREPIGLG